MFWCLNLVLARIDNVRPAYWCTATIEGDEGGAQSHGVLSSDNPKRACERGAAHVRVSILTSMGRPACCHDRQAYFGRSVPTGRELVARIARFGSHEVYTQYPHPGDNARSVYAALPRIGVFSDVVQDLALRFTRIDPSMRNAGLKGLSCLHLNKLKC